MQYPDFERQNEQLSLGDLVTVALNREYNRQFFCLTEFLDQELLDTVPSNLEMESSEIRRLHQLQDTVSPARAKVQFLYIKLNKDTHLADDMLILDRTAPFLATARRFQNLLRSAEYLEKKLSTDEVVTVAALIKFLAELQKELGAKIRSINPENISHFTTATRDAVFLLYIEVAEVIQKIATKYADELSQVSRIKYTGYRIYNLFGNGSDNATLITALAEAFEQVPAQKVELLLTALEQNCLTELDIHNWKAWLEVSSNDRETNVVPKILTTVQQLTLAQAREKARIFIQKIESNLLPYSQNEKEVVLNKLALEHDKGERSLHLFVIEHTFDELEKTLKFPLKSETREQAIMHFYEIIATNLQTLHVLIIPSNELGPVKESQLSCIKRIELLHLRLLDILARLKE